MGGYPSSLILPFFGPSTSANSAGEESQISDFCQQEMLLQILRSSAITPGCHVILGIDFSPVPFALRLDLHRVVQFVAGPALF